jgi:SAM-dependent methyltransferase
MADHAERIETAFTQQAEQFEDNRVNRVFRDTQWLLDAIELTGTELVLDVAGGTGQLARAIAPRAGTAVVLDATRAMLDAGHASATRDGVGNLLFVHGDAAALPFTDASFDVVISRFALHHFVDPEAAVAEMARCVRPGGQLVLCDMVGCGDAGVDRLRDELETLRDPSHVRVPTADELEGWARGSGREVAATATSDHGYPVDGWLARAFTDEASKATLNETLDAELDAGGPATGLEPWRKDDGSRWIRHYLVAVVARC